MSKSDTKRGTFIHGIGASEHLDSSGERIIVSGIDISSLTRDGVFNFEHKSENATQIVGKILEAKKILKRSDCENDNHRYFWDKVKMPFLYVAGELFDAVGHSGAKDVAAMIKYDAQGHENDDAKNLINFSIEGSRLEKRGSEITKCIARKMTITITPCNKVAVAEEMKREDIEKDSKSAEKADSGDFAFIQDIVLGKNEHMSSCQIAKNINPGEMGFINTNIKSEKSVNKNITPKRTFTPQTAPDKIRVGDRIKYPKPKTGKDIYGSPKKESQLRQEKFKDRQEKVKNPSPSKPADGYSMKEGVGSGFKKGKSEAKSVKKAKVDERLPEEERRKVRAERKQSSSSPGYTQQQASVRSKIRQKMKLGKYDSNVRKALTAACGMGSPGTKTQGDAIQKEQVEKQIHNVSKSEVRAVMKQISEESFQRFEKKEELLDFLAKRLPNTSDKERLALAKAISYIREKKQELKLKALVEDE